eukprot:TRINITY_DN7625_c0_g6_i1.p1 TRINITY_DN7625_c0_g6~~TRINITY_DN7625_c0_g6_i1.p1  ORF type:complete len:204 (-),score=33.41 TRINITY_DN7625_c0_g6_i1:111-722(-)
MQKLEECDQRELCYIACEEAMSKTGEFEFNVQRMDRHVKRLSPEDQMEFLTLMKLVRRSAKSGNPILPRRDDQEPSISKMSEDSRSSRQVWLPSVSMQHRFGKTPSSHSLRPSDDSSLRSSVQQLPHSNPTLTNHTSNSGSTSNVSPSPSMFLHTTSGQEPTSLKNVEPKTTSRRFGQKFSSENVKQSKIPESSETLNRDTKF